MPTQCPNPGEEAGEGGVNDVQRQFLHLFVFPQTLRAASRSPLSCRACARLLYDDARPGASAISCCQRGGGGGEREREREREREKQGSNGRRRRRKMDKKKEGEDDDEDEEEESKET